MFVVFVDVFFFGNRRTRSGGVFGMVWLHTPTRKLDEAERTFLDPWDLRINDVLPFERGGIP